jgi:hypothetical protein
MRRSIGMAATAAGAMLAALGALAQQAAAQSGGGKVERLGDKTADLFSDILGPVIIVLVALVGLVAFLKREIGVAVTAAAIALFLGLFVFAPESAESLIKGFWQKIA